MAGVGWEWSGMGTENGQEWPGLGGNGQEWLRLYGNGQSQALGMVRVGWEWPGLGTAKWPEPGENGQGWA